MEIIRPPNIAHRAANYITLRVSLERRADDSGSCDRPRCQYVNEIRSLGCDVRYERDSKGRETCYVGFRSYGHCAANTENRLSGSESMPFVLHYSVQSNTASGIRVSRRASSIDICTYIVQYHRRVYNTSLRRAKFLFRNAERRIFNESLD